MKPSNEVANCACGIPMSLTCTLNDILSWIYSCSLTALIPLISCKARLDTYLLNYVCLHTRDAKTKVSIAETTATKTRKCLYRKCKEIFSLSFAQKYMFT